MTRRTRTVTGWTRLILGIMLLPAGHVACAGAASQRGAAPARQGPGALETELEENRTRWAERGFADYDLELQRICFCPDELTQPVVVSVRASKVASVSVARTGQPVDPGYAGIYPDVEGLFSIIRDAIDSGAASIDAAYDAARGFPTLVDIDYEREAIDEEMLYAVHELTPTERRTAPQDHELR